LKNIEKNSNGLAWLVFGAFGHCSGGGDIKIPFNYTAELGLAFALGIDLFSIEAMGLSKKLEAPHIVFFVFGPDEPNARGNYYKTVEDWPTVTNSSYYLTLNGQLTNNVPTIPNTQVNYDFDPSNPVPSIGGPNLMFLCGPRNQQSIEARPDVVIFTSDVLTSDLSITGNIWVEMYVSSNQTDTDFTAKVTDVYPTGRSELIQDGILRMKWRESASEPTLMQPGKIYKITIDVWSISYIFNKGHKIRLAISSSNTPRFSVNPNNGLLINQGGPKLVAKNTIYYGQDYPSRLILPVVNLN